MFVDQALFFLLFGVITGCCVSMLIMMHEILGILRWLKADRMIETLKNADLKFINKFENLFKEIKDEGENEKEETGSGVSS